MQLEAGVIRRAIAFPMASADPDQERSSRLGHARDCNAREGVAKRGADPRPLRREGSLSVQGPAVKGGSGLMGEYVGSSGVGGLRAWLMGGLVCARAPSLISVRGPGLFRVGDMMVDGVIPLGGALRPLCL